MIKGVRSPSTHFSPARWTIPRPLSFFRGDLCPAVDVEKRDREEGTNETTEAFKSSLRSGKHSNKSDHFIMADESRRNILKGLGIMRHQRISLSGPRDKT